MKRIKVVVVVLCTILFLTACGKKSSSAPDEVAQKMINDIDSIGDVTLDDEEQINKLLSIYSTLTDKQKESVNNYAALLEAKDQLDELKAEETAELNEKLNEKHMKYALIISRDIRKGLLDPDSFNLLDVVYSDFSDGCIAYSIHFSGSNKLGGVADQFIYVLTPNSGAETGLYYVDESSKDYAAYGVAFSRIERGDPEAISAGWGEAVYLDVSFIMEHMDN